MDKPILNIENLKVIFHTKYGDAKAVNNVNFSLQKGEKLGIVGESGSGKSVTSKSIIRLLPKDNTTIEGKIMLGDVDLLSLSEKQMREYRGNRISMIFQEPMVSLNPLYTIGNQLIESLRKHQKISKQEAKKKALEMLTTVGIPSPETRLKQYPFELSGGMRQRVMIAMALLCNPEVLIADEPTTALDVTIQAQILELLNDLNQKFGTSIIMITHDLGVIAETVDTVIVMYAGSIVEKASVKDLFESPKHPYTEGLLNSVPSMEDSDKPLETIEGNVPSIYHLPEGCAFSNRCKYTCDICLKEKPPVTKINENLVSCWKYTQNWKQGGQ